MTQKTEWHRVAEAGQLEDNSATSVAAGVKALCLAKFEGQYFALDNHCPHQGGPLGEGLIENGFARRRWHGYEYSPQDGAPPGGYDDRVETIPLEQREDGIYVAVEPLAAADTVSKQMLEVAADWGIDACFGMVGHPNLALAETIEAPFIATFKAKGFIADDHPLACGVLGGSGAIVGSTMMERADVLLVFGASFSNHTGISKTKKIIQVDFDRMALGKFHPMDIPLWGDIGATCTALTEALAGTDCGEKRHYVRREIARRWQLRRAEKAQRARESDEKGINWARLFAEMSAAVPEDAVLAVDVGNNTYSFGRYFEAKLGQECLMSGYLGSIGFGFPAAIGAALAAPARPIWAVAGDGGFGQYAMEVTTAVQYQLPIKLALLNNSEIGKEQRGVNVPVCATALVNPNFAEFARSCGAWGLRVSRNDELRAGLEELKAIDGPGSLE